MNWALVQWSIWQFQLNVEAGAGKCYVGPMRVGYRSDQTKAQIITRLGR